MDEFLDRVESDSTHNNMEVFIVLMSDYEPEPEPQPEPEPPEPEPEPEPRT